MADDAAWQCPACTLLNKMSIDRCGVCSEPRPAGFGKPAAALLQPAAAAQAAPKPVAAAPAPAAAPARPVVPAAAAGGLSEKERRAKEEEMAHKRQKKEEEKRRILEQAEADRAERLGRSATGAAAPAPAAPAAAATGSAPAAAAQQGSRPVKLQLRCPQWSGRSVTFTCFGSDSTLADVRHCLREELVSGEQGTGDGRLLAGASRVPPEEAIILVDRGPPPRRFATAEDYQKTLSELGLCPSALLLVEAAPLELPPEPPAAVAPARAASPPRAPPPVGRPGQDGGGSDDDADSGTGGGAGGGAGGGSDDDSGSDDGTGGGGGGWGGPGGPGGMPGMPGRGGPGRGGGRQQRQYGGTFGANWRFGNRDTGRPSDGPRIGAGGQIVPIDAAAGGGETEDRRAAREARLAALDRRGATPGVDEAALGPGRALGAGPAAAAAPVPAAVAPAAMDTKQKKEAEKAEILRRIEEERAERAAAHQPLAAAPAADAAGAAAAAAARTSLARVPGQMGGGGNKAERMREREQILQRLEEDRQRYNVTRGGPAAPAPAAAVSHQAAGAARLQIREQASGRKVVTTAFEATSLLSAVRDFAAAELGLPGDPPAVLALSFPPFTVLDQPEQLGSTLGALGLCPSAALVIKEGRHAYLAAADAAGAGTEAGVPPAVPAAEPAGAPAAEASVGGPGIAGARCPAGHAMTALQMLEEGWCDKCSEVLPEGSPAYECRQCDYYQCPPCSQ